MKYINIYCFLLGYEGTYEDDIALFKLERSVAEEITSHNNIMPACSPRTQLDHVGRNGLVAGWGKTGYPSKNPYTI